MMMYLVNNTENTKKFKTSLTLNNLAVYKWLN